MSKHTPGPWVDPAGSDWNYGLDDDPCWYAAVRDDAGESVAVAYHEDRDVMHANARLIAAAPDLLEACKNVSEYFATWEQPVDDDGAEWWLRDLRAATSKATGETVKA